MESFDDMYLLKAWSRVDSHLLWNVELQEGVVYAVDLHFFVLLMGVYNIVLGVVFAYWEIIEDFAFFILISYYETS